MQVCTLLQTDNHASTPPLSFIQAGCPSYRPTNSIKALKAISHSVKTFITYTVIKHKVRAEPVFVAYRENILKTAKALVEDTKTLVAGAASNQEQLAGAAESAVMTITRLADCVKHGAASLGSEQPEAQVSV